MSSARLFAASLCSCLLACSGEAPAPAPAGPTKLPTVEPTNPAPAPAAPAPAAAAAPDPNEEACARVILVSYAGAQPPTEGVTRDKKEAKARAEELLAKVKAGADFIELARTESDGESSSARDGITGTFKRANWPVMHLPIADAVYKLKVDELAPEVIQTTYGFVLLKRCAIEKAHSRHILIRYKGAKRAEDDVKRTKKAAEKLAAGLLKKLKKGADFAELAKKESEDSSAERGGDIGLQPRGVLAPPYEKALFALKPGERSGVVETEMGFHIIERLPD